MKTKPFDEFLPGTSRIEAFSDGVFAVSLTLLVLDLRVPQMQDGIALHDSIKIVLALFPQFLSFAISFAVVAIFWVNHHHLFHILERSDRKLLWLNNLLLFWLSVIPFPTAFIGKYPQLPIASIVYGIVLFLTATTFTVMYAYAACAKSLMYEWVTEETRKSGIKKGIIGPALYLFSVIIAPFSTHIAIFTFILLPIFYFLPQRITKIEVP
jgi:uncharacterized membrane protein